MMNKFETLLNDNAAVLTDGPMETRIEYGTDIKLDKEMSIFTLAETDEGRSALAKLYSEDINTVKSYGLPIILNAPLFRASREHCDRLGLPSSADDILRINKAGVDLIKAVQRDFSDYAEKIILAAPIGPKFAGFTPDVKTDLQTEIDYHAQQIAALEKCGVDVILISVMPGGVEAIGAAIAASRQSMPYTVGFIMNAEACLLDGMPVHEVIATVEEETKSNPPVGYIVGCTHPSVAKQALSHEHEEYKRIIGLKANGSNKPPKELLKLNQPLADPAGQFAEDILALGKPRGFKIYGGCCGTDSSHLQALSEKILGMLS